MFGGNKYWHASVSCEVFYDWIKDGFCDFYEVDFVFKNPLSGEAEQELKQITVFMDEDINGTWSSYIPTCVIHSLIVFIQLKLLSHC